MPKTREAIRARERKDNPDNKLVDLRGALEKVVEQNKKPAASKGKKA